MYQPEVKEEREKEPSRLFQQRQKPRIKHSRSHVHELLSEQEWGLEHDGLNSLEFEIKKGKKKAEEIN